MSVGSIKIVRDMIFILQQHGVPRAATREQRSAEARQKELKEIEQYKNLVSEIQRGVQ